MVRKKCASNDKVVVGFILASSKIKGTIERKYCVTKEDSVVRKKMMFSLLRTGIAMKKLDDIKESVESISNQNSLILEMCLQIMFNYFWNQNLTLSKRKF